MSGERITWRVSWGRHEAGSLLYPGPHLRWLGWMDFDDRRDAAEFARCCLLGGYDSVKLLPASPEADPSV